MFCQKCGAQHDIVTVLLIDISCDSAENDSAELFCESCCIDNGLFCHEHGGMIVHYDSEAESDDGPAFVFPYGFCPRCCTEEVHKLSARERQAKLDTIRQFLPSEVTNELLGDSAINDVFARDSLLLFEIFKVMMLYGQSFEEILTSLMPEVDQVIRNN